MQVLLIGGYRPLVKALKLGLEEEGFTVDVAHDIDEGRTRAATGTYDVVVLDLMRPQSADPELLGGRRHDFKGKVLALTAPAVGDGNRCDLDVEVDDYLTVPFALEELFARLRALGVAAPANRERARRSEPLLVQASRSTRKDQWLCAFTSPRFSSSAWA